MVPFSLDGYTSLIEAGKAAGYLYYPLNEAIEASGKRIALRHDVDFDLDCARQLAELEAGLGVRSTYFVLVCGEYYSALDSGGRKALRDIAALGHEIGLHWDSSYCETPDSALALVRHERDLLSSIVGRPVLSASQHIPTDSAYFNIASLFKLEAYSAIMRDKFTYVADSSMRWRAKTPLDLIAEGLNIQLNTHPLWWTVEGDSADTKLRAVLERRTGIYLQRYDEFIRYMNHVLDNRAAYDAKFEASRPSIG